MIFKYDVCKELVYRCKVNHFINSKGHIVYSSRFIPMKRLSCPGCPKCGGLLECLDGDLPLVSSEVNNQLYSLEMVNISRDWESGHVDEWDLEFREI